MLRKKPRRNASQSKTPLRSESSDANIQSQSFNLALTPNTMATISSVKGGQSIHLGGNHLSLQYKRAGSNSQRNTDLSSATTPNGVQKQFDFETHDIGCTDNENSAQN